MKRLLALALAFVAGALAVILLPAGWDEHDCACVDETDEAGA